MAEPLDDESVATFGLEDLWSVILTQGRTMAAVFAVVVTLVVGVTALEQPTYRATSTIHLTIPVSQEIGERNLTASTSWSLGGGYVAFYMTQIEVMESAAILDEVIRRYREAIGGELDEITSAGALRSRLQIELRRQTEIIDLRVEHNDPERAAMLANLVAQVYREHNLASARDAATEARVWLADQLDEYTARIDTLNQQVIAYQDDNDLEDAEQAVTSLGAKVDALKARLASVRTEAVALASDVAQYDRLLAKQAWSDLAEQLNAPLLTALTTQYAEAMSAFVKVDARYGDKHPAHIAARAIVERVEEETRHQVQEAVAAQRARLGILEASAATLEAEIGSMNEALLEKQRVRDGYDRLRTEITRSARYESNLAQRMDELTLLARTQLNNVRLLATATPPLAPFAPNWLFRIAVGLVLASVAAMGAGLLRHQLDETINTPLDAGVHLRVPVLGTVPRLPDSVDTAVSRALYTHEHPHSVLSESVRAIRNVIERTVPHHGSLHLLVTSSLIGEGKTDSSARIAIAFARSGKRVAIIDADLRRPRQHKAFGIEDKSPGFTDLLDGVDVIDVVRPTGVPNLDLIPAGSGGAPYAELFGTPAIDEVLERLDDRYDVILFDTPPVILTADPAILSKHVHGVVFVVLSGKVQRRAVQHAVQALRKVDAPVAGVVINGAERPAGMSRYGYYGGRYGYYRYGSYSEDDADTDDSSNAAK